ncbi:uncharacterized protein VTP21DRAFT_10244 [Calcarisporiella thermophila]|uniref:uncharacterized protein n=1 Tax=Calcarisporiella thermophila TaxID=911321 RepID=UPI00374468EB
MGGGGQLEHYDVDRANAALYACFAVVGYAAGGITNLLGIKLTLFIGCLGYVLYAGSLLSYNISRNGGFVIASGALLGVTAGMLWAAQGAIMMSYPTPKAKGRYLSLFWAIFNIGGVMGGIIPLILNLNNNGAGSISNETYIAIISVMFLGTLLSLLMLPPSRVIRDDGTPVGTAQFPDWRAEVKEIARLATNWKLLALAPMCFSSNFYYTYMFNAVNGFYFNVRTRSLNNVIFWSVQIVGAGVFGYFLDSKLITNDRSRALLGFFLACLIVIPTWIGGVIFQLTFDRYQTPIGADWFDTGYGRLLTLFALYGLNDALWQVYCFWLMGKLTDDPQKLSHYAGFNKGVQAAGGAVAWAIDGAGITYRTQVVANCVLLLTSIPFTIAVITKIFNQPVAVNEKRLRLEGLRENIE